MSDQKRLLTELLPAPKSVIPSSNPRERVARHWHKLVTTGAAAAALAGCGCLVMDPLPNPAQCRTTRSLLSQVSFIATPQGAGSLSLQVEFSGAWENATLSFLSIEGGTLVSSPSGALSLPADLRINPAGAGQPITVVFTTTCEGTAATSLKVVLTPQGVDAGTDAGATGWTVTASDL
jgi:hypothetical protein